MKAAESILIVVGVLVMTLFFSQAALACMDHETETDPIDWVENPGGNGDYCEFQDGDCAEGYECTGLPCVMATCDPDDENCAEELQCPMGGICMPIEPDLSCETDADCGEGQVCAVYETFCDVLAIPCEDGDEDCAPIENEDCQQSVFGQCEEVFIDPAQCSTDTDCESAAFECQLEEICECTTAAFDGENTEDAEPCVCTTLDTGYCQLIEKACETQADCTGAHEGFECTQQFEIDRLCTFDIETGEEWCSEPQESKVCTPKYTGAPNTPPTDAQNLEAGNSRSATAGGCHIGGSSNTGTLALPFLMALGLLAVRRRVGHRA